MVPPGATTSRARARASPRARAPRGRAAGARGPTARGRARRRAALDQLPARLPGRGRSRAAGALRRRSSPVRSTRSRRTLRAPLPRRTRTRARCASASSSAFFRDGTVGRYFERWITDLPRALSRCSSITCCPASTRSRRGSRARRPLPALPALRARRRSRRDSRRRARRARLSRARHGRDDVRARGAAARAAAVRGWGHPVTTGHATIDVFFTARGDGAARTRRPTTPSASCRCPASARATRAPRCRCGATRAALGLPADGRCSSARSRCSRSIPTTTRCSRACSPRCRTRRLVRVRGAPSGADARAIVRASTPRSQRRACARASA